MRNFIEVLSILLMLVSSSASQGWDDVNSPVKETITGICAVSPDTFFIVTGEGSFARTYDAGKSWEVLPVGDKVHFEDVSFANSLRGVVCGRNGALYRTLDGGTTWENKSISDTMPWFLDVEMFNVDTGLVIGMTRDSASPFGGLSFRTTDAGQTWKKQEGLGLGYTEIEFQQGGPVHLLTFGRLYRSDDLGRTWKSAKTVEGGVARAVSIVGKTGVLAGPNGMFAFSTDSGKTWSKLDQRSDKLYIASELVDEKVGYAGGMNAAMMRTTDGGRTWKQELLVRSFNVLDMCLIGDRLFAVGSEGAIISKKVK